MVAIYVPGARRTSILRCLGDLGDDVWEDCGIRAIAQSQALCKAFGERRYDGNWLGAAGRSLISKAITGILIRSPGDERSGTTQGSAWQTRRAGRWRELNGVPISSQSRKRFPKTKNKVTRDARKG